MKAQYTDYLPYAYIWPNSSAEKVHPLCYYSRRQPAFGRKGMSLEYTTKLVLLTRPTVMVFAEHAPRYDVVYTEHTCTYTVIL